MQETEEPTFIIDNFEGPLDFLLHLIQKNEIDIYEVPINKIIDQFLEKLQNHLTDIDTGAEFIATAATLLCLKSKMLLPKHEQAIDPDELEEDPNFEIIHHLIDYCRFKQAAKSLSEREQQQSGFYSRGVESLPDIKKTLGIEHLTLDDLAGLFKEIASKAAANRGTVHEDVWKVSDKIKYVRKILKEELKIGFESLFSAEMPRLELIVTFLAVLELMKLGEACVIRDKATERVMVCSPSILTQ